MEEQKMFDLEDLPRTYIRAKDEDGKWGSFSFAELLATKHGQHEIIMWFGSQMLRAAGSPADGSCTEDAAVNMCRIREIIVGPLAKLKDVQA